MMGNGTEQPEGQPLERKGNETKFFVNRRLMRQRSSVHLDWMIST
jgi:hypothetical protein